MQERVAILGKKKMPLLYAAVPRNVLPTSLGGTVDMPAVWAEWIKERQDTHAEIVSGSAPRRGWQCF